MGCFHMTIRSTLSKPALRYRGVPPSRLATSGDSRPVALPRDAEHGSQVAAFLIANARLESPVTQTKQTAGASSNRERIAICHSLSFRPHITRQRSLATIFPWTPWPARPVGRLIYCAPIKIPRKTLKIWDIRISNRRPQRRYEMNELVRGPQPEALAREEAA